jgi:hypothetical protein
LGRRALHLEILVYYIPMRKAEIAEISCALQFASLLARQATAEPKKRARLQDERAPLE